jgi:Fe-S-cluster-containing dehydrogenase component
MDDGPGALRRAKYSRPHGPVSPLTRRAFLRALAATSAGLAVFGPHFALGAKAPVIIVDNALGLVLADPSRCVGCLRCELACTEFNRGVASPVLARIKVARNLAYGPAGPNGPQPAQGFFGNGVFVQDACRQCPHPVPCATACPNGAIVLDPKTRARVVDQAACTGCRLCQGACPYAMMVFDEAAAKADKCDLCRGEPKCVAACPAGALAYASWRDLTRELTARRPTVLALDPKRAAACRDCHR